MAGTAEIDPRMVAELGSALQENIQRAVKVSDEVVRGLLVALLGEGHVLIEDVPGIGKTAVARALARSLDAEYSRIQCTNDLLPADVIGTNVFLQQEGRFDFRPGPVFANVVLVDEINRASPKTQSGLLEAMQERRVTLDKQSHELARPFLVIATQNPVEYEGTYPLPEGQLDRFMVRLSLGYPDRREEIEMLEEQARGDQVLELEPVAGVGEVLEAQAAVREVHGSEELRGYVVRLAELTRSDPRVILGASPRAGLLLFRSAKALAALESRDHVIPDDVQALATPVLAHRILLAPGHSEEERTTVIDDALDRVPAL